MRKYLHFSLVALYVLFCSSCKEEIHEISPNKLDGFWELQNEVDFSDMTFKNMYFHTEFEMNTYIVDPVISDTIYWFGKVCVKGDTLYMDKLAVRIKELSDSLLILRDFPGASDDLVFANYHYYHGFKKERCSYSEDIIRALVSDTTTILAKDFPKDSLDVIIRSNDDVFHFQCTNSQMFKARRILEDYMNKKEYLKDDWKWDIEPKPFDNYFRQYIGWKLNDGKTTLMVYLNSYLPHFPYRYMAMKSFIPFFPFTFHEPKNVSIEMIRVEIDMSEGRIVRFEPEPQISEEEIKEIEKSYEVMEELDD